MGACLWCSALDRFGVQLSRKVQKLFSVDTVESRWEHVCRWTHSVSSQPLLATIDRAELESLRERYPYRPNAPKINAYEDADYWIGVNVKPIRDLWLDRVAPLDIPHLRSSPPLFSYHCTPFPPHGPPL